MDKHSKLPYFLRLHGSVLPKMILPLLFVGVWASIITVLYFKGPGKFSVDPILLTVLGFVVGLALSFRSSTAYERYAEGRKYWAQLILTSRNLARLIWVHAQERHEESPELGKEDLLSKLSAMNLILAFAVALKHKLRFEPSANYHDLEHLISHLNTYAHEAEDPSQVMNTKVSSMKRTGEYLGVSFAESNPRKFLKRSKKNLGNLPLEILTYLSAYMETIMTNKTLATSIHQTHVMNALQSMNEVLTGTERVLNTPLPLAYSISISQITWVYVVLLPFQLIQKLEWITIPGTMVAAYIILGIAAIGREIENPFGRDVNDLPLDAFCTQLSAEIDVITSMPPPDPKQFFAGQNNKVLYPLSMKEYAAWNMRTVEEIREALRIKATTASIANEGTKTVSQKDQINNV